MSFLEAIRDVIVHAGERCYSPFNAPEQNLPHSPMHRMPVELLGEIFFHYLDSHERKPHIWSSYLSVSSECTANPFIFGHICRYWRSVALSTPMLWASLAICEPRPYMVPLVREWLDRAADCPLSLYLVINIKPTTTQAVTANTLISLFVSHFHQWKQIELRLPETNVPLLHLPLGGAPRLQSATLFLRRWATPSADKVWRSISSSPNLRRVSWDPWYMQHEVPTHIPWAQLTHVNMTMGRSSLSPDAFLEILRSCQSLVELDFDARILCNATPRIAPFVLSNLRTLKLRGISCDPTEYLNCLILPALTSIDIIQYSKSSHPGIVYLKDLFARSACQLERASLADSGIEEIQIIDFLCSIHVQAVNDLYVRTRAITHATISFLKNDPAHLSCVLPCLKRLSLYDCDITDGALSEMLTTRLPVLEAFNGSAISTNSYSSSGS